MDQTRHTPRRVLLLALLASTLTWWTWQAGHLVIPDEWKPWTPLQIDALPNVLTRQKLARDSVDPLACRSVLAQAQMRLRRLDDRETGVGCGFDNAVTIERTSVAVGEAFSLTCRAALSLAMWERHELQQAAQRHLGSKVAKIEHFGSYACRNLYGQAGRARSQHATADALDIAGFVLEDGRRIRVVSDWHSPQPLDKINTRRQSSARSAVSRGGAAPPEAAGSEEANAEMSAEAAFLRDLHTGACRYFDVVLGPNYNRAHADHFHFDRGRARICR